MKLAAFAPEGAKTAAPTQSHHTTSTQMHNNANENGNRDNQVAQRIIITRYNATMTLVAAKALATAITTIQRAQCTLHIQSISFFPYWRVCAKRLQSV